MKIKDACPPVKSLAPGFAHPTAARAVMRPHVQLLEGPLRLARRLVKRIVRRKTQPLHPLAKPRDKAKISAENFSKPIRLRGGKVIRVHLARVYTDSTRHEWSKKRDLKVEQQTAAPKIHRRQHGCANGKN